MCVYNITLMGINECLVLQCDDSGVRLYCAKLAHLPVPGRVCVCVDIHAWVEQAWTVKYVSSQFAGTYVANLKSVVFNLVKMFISFQVIVA